MKFLIVAPRFHTNLYYRVKALQDAGHSVKIVVLYKGKSEFYEDIDFQKIRLSFFSRILMNTISFFKKNNLKTAFELRIQSPGKELKQILKFYKPDVILLKAYQNMLAVKTLLTAKICNTKVLMLTQTTYTHIKGSQLLFKFNIKLFKLLKVFAYITPIKSNFNSFINFGIENVYYLPFVFPQKKIILNKQKKNINILSVGKFQNRKEQLLLLKVFRQLSDENYKIKLCLIGELADKKYFDIISNFIQSNLLSNNVCIKTNISYSEIMNEYQKYDIFILPAYNEPAAYSPVEALANGLPVICSDENGTKCYIEEGKNGYVFKAKKFNDLYEKIKLCISDKEKLKEMKKNALFSAKENHNPELFVKRILEIVK
ncbi:MAG: glycosyltransferase [Chlorobi bacterium]|nr:glycosyltransferase [Chlorobiota bacterium]